MKIAIVVKDLQILGGAERVAVNLANYLSRTEDVTLISYLDIVKEKIAFEIFPSVKIVGLGVERFKTKENLYRFRLFYKYRNWKFLEKELKKNDFDIVIGNHVFPGVSVFKKCNNSIFLGIHHICYEALDPKIFSNGDGRIPLLNIKKYIGYRIKIYYRNNTYKKLKHLIVLTERERNKFYEAGVRNTVVIPNAIEAVDSNKYVNQVRDKNMIALGRLVYQKGFDRLITIIEPVLKKNPDWKLTIYGSGPDKKKIMALIDKLEVQGKVVLEEPIKDITQKLLNSRFYLMTSRYEGFPMVLLEAMNCGLPVISYDINSGPRDIIVDSEDGYLIKEDDETLFRQRVEELISNTELCSKMSHNARLNVSRFSWESVGCQWISTLEKCLLGNAE
jgi:glycosyltransferase involved in cell wall biosynthesis